MSDPTPAAAAAPAPKPGRKKLMVILTIVAVVLVGGGAGAFFLLKPAAADVAQAKGHAKVESDPIYVALDPPFVVNFESNQLVRFLQVSVQVMTRDPAVVELVKRHDPVIRNGLLMLLSGQKYESLSSAAGKEHLREIALAEVRKTVAAQGGQAADIQDLYFTSFVMQ